MSRLLIIYHSRTGGTRQMASAAYEAAKDELETTLKTAPEVTIDDMLSADGYIFAAPENLASMSGAMKEFSTKRTMVRSAKLRVGLTRR